MSSRPSDEEYNVIQTIINKTTDPTIYRLSHSQKKGMIQQIWQRIRTSDNWEEEIGRFKTKHKSHLPTQPAPIRTRKITSFFSRTHNKLNNDQSQSSSSPQSLQSSDSNESELFTKSTSLHQSHSRPISLHQIQSKPKPKPKPIPNTKYSAPKPKQQQLLNKIKDLKNEINTTRKYCVYAQHTNPTQYNELKKKIKEMQTNVNKLQAALDKQVRKSCSAKEVEKEQKEAGDGDFE